MIVPSCIDKDWAEEHEEKMVLGQHKGGYAGDPGSGPRGETCRSCRNYTRLRVGPKIYRRCFLLQLIWTRGKATAINAHTAACNHWQVGDKKKVRELSGQTKEMATRLG